MAEFTTVCRVGELTEGEGKTVQVGKKLVALFLWEGQYLAIDDMCPHMGASLSGGYVENGIVTCPWHAWRFRLQDGAWADNPRIKIGCFAVRVDGNEVQVEAPPDRQEDKETRRQGDKENGSDSPLM
jgi:nitrite reductase (NADH) small subunit/3-phenylpropionate/trans-cinnamate dioxygenase ferredoxin subunit